MPWLRENYSRGKAMKKIALILGLTLSVSAQAQQVFVLPNNGGGEIVITDRPCIVNNKNFEHFREGYSWTPTVAKMNACWTVRDGYVVFVYLSDGEERIYPIERFREKK
jgi:hypothetical protein